MNIPLYTDPQFQLNLSTISAVILRDFSITPTIPDIVVAFLTIIPAISPTHQHFHGSQKGCDISRSGLLMVPTTATVVQVLSILQSDPFRRFSMSEIQPQLPAQSLPDLQKTMVELYEGLRKGLLGKGRMRWWKRQGRVVVLFGRLTIDTAFIFWIMLSENVIRTQTGTIFRI